MLKKCPSCKSETMATQEYKPSHPQYYNGASELVCMNCGNRYGRWCGLPLGPNEVEPRFCVVKATGYARAGHGVVVSSLRSSTEES